MVAPKREPNRAPLSSPGPHSLHLFARRVLIAVGLIALAAAVALVVWYTFWVWLLAFAGILLAVFLRSIALGISRVTRLPMGWSLLIGVVLLLGAIAGASVGLAPRINDQMLELRTTLPEAMEAVTERVRQFAVGEFIFDRVGEMDTDEIQPVLAAGAATILGNIVHAALAVLVVLFIGLYLAIDPKMYIDGALRLISPPKRPRLREVLHETGRLLMWWLFARVVAMAFVGVVTAIGLMVLGVPLAFTLGLIAAILDFVPNVGPFIAAAPAVLIAFAESPRLALYVLILYIVVQQLESYVVTPIVQQHVVKIPAALTVFVQVLFFVLAGLPGLFLATPITVAAIVLVGELYVKDTLGDVDEKEEEEEAGPQRDGRIVRIGGEARAAAKGREN